MSITARSPPTPGPAVLVKPALAAHPHYLRARNICTRRTQPGGPPAYYEEQVRLLLANRAHMYGITPLAPGALGSRCRSASCIPPTGARLLRRRPRAHAIKGPATSDVRALREDRRLSKDQRQPSKHVNHASFPASGLHAAWSGVVTSCR